MAEVPSSFARGLQTDCLGLARGTLMGCGYGLKNFFAQSRYWRTCLAFMPLEILLMLNIWLSSVCSLGMRYYLSSQLIYVLSLSSFSLRPFPIFYRECLMEVGLLSWWIFLTMNEGQSLEGRSEMQIECLLDRSQFQALLEILLGVPFLPSAPITFLRHFEPIAFLTVHAEAYFRPLMLYRDATSFLRISFKIWCLI